jgi:hypothetical protein
MSALLALENSTLTFVVPAAGTSVDPDTGNVVANTETIECAAYLKAESVAEATYPGVNVVSTLYEGYITSGALDSRVVVGSSGEVEFAGADPVECEVLEARLPYGTAGLMGEVLTGVLGSKVRLVSRTQS